MTRPLRGRSGPWAGAPGFSRQPPGFSRQLPGFSHQPPRPALAFLPLALLLAGGPAPVRAGDAVPAEATARARRVPMQSIAVQPPRVELRGPAARQRLVVEGVLSDGSRLDLTAAA